MTSRTRTRVVLLLGSAAMIAVVLAAMARGGAGITHYAGCLDNPKGTGQLYYVQVGETPQQPCAAGDIEIHLSGGDVTAVLAGAGLTGGGVGGELPLGLASGYRLPQGCPNGNAPQWNGTGWACVDPATQAELNTHKSSTDHDARYRVACPANYSVFYATLCWESLDTCCFTFADAATRCADRSPGGRLPTYAEILAFQRHFGYNTLLDWTGSSSADGQAIYINSNSGTDQDAERPTTTASWVWCVTPPLDAAGYP